jgi:hypothetical protein
MAWDARGDHWLQDLLVIALLFPDPCGHPKLSDSGIRLMQAIPFINMVF